MNNTCERLVIDDNRPVLQVVRETVCHRIADERPEQIVVESPQNRERLVVSEGGQGPAGPAGPASTGETYIHSQSIPSATWTIAHNLGQFPSITVVDSAGTVVVGGISYTDSNTLVVSFTAAFAGKAYLN